MANVGLLLTRRQGLASGHGHRSSLEGGGAGEGYRPDGPGAASLRPHRPAEPVGVRTAAGHRLYTPDDVARLYRIRLLRGLGFPLEQIASVLEDPGWPLGHAVRRHLEHT